MEVETFQQIDGGLVLCPLGVGVSLLPVLREGGYGAQPDGYRSSL
jgi:hypothetical protein